MARFTEKLPPGHPNAALAQIRLGHTLVLEGQYKEAERHLLAGYGVLVKQPGPQANRVRNARKDLITVYEALHQPDQAKRFEAELAASPPEQASNPSKR